MTEEIVLTRINAKCICCGAKKVYHLPAEDVKAWCNGKLIQEALPQLPAEDREFLISGLCPKCWDKLFIGVGDDAKEGKNNG